MVFDGHICILNTDFLIKLILKQREFENKWIKIMNIKKPFKKKKKSKMLHILEATNLITNKLGSFPLITLGEWGWGEGSWGVSNATYRRWGDKTL